MTTHNCVLSIPCKHNVIVKKKKTRLWKTYIYCTYCSLLNKYTNSSTAFLLHTSLFTVYQYVTYYRNFILS